MMINRPACLALNVRREEVTGQPAGDEIGEGGGVEGEVLAEVHASQPRAWVTGADAIP